MVSTYKVEGAVSDKCCNLQSEHHQTPPPCLPGVDIHAGYIGVQVVVVRGAATALALVPRVPGLALALEPVHLTNQRLCPEYYAQTTIQRSVLNPYYIYHRSVLCPPGPRTGRRADTWAPAAARTRHTGAGTCSRAE